MLLVNRELSAPAAFGLGNSVLTKGAIAAPASVCTFECEGGRRLEKAEKTLSDGGF